MREIEKLIRDGEDTAKRARTGIIVHAGKLIALLAMTVGVLVTFTDVTFADLGTEEVTCRFVLLLVLSAVMFYSMAHEGERLSLAGDDYLSVRSAFDTAAGNARGKSGADLRAFCDRVSEEEYRARLRSSLLPLGLSEEEFEAIKAGGRPALRALPRKTARRLRRLFSLRPRALSPDLLLASAPSERTTAVSDPTRTHLLRLSGKLVPSLVMMSVTVSVILTAKEGLTPEVVAEGIVRLSALLAVGLRGYLAGYAYVRDRLVPWYAKKAHLIETFLAQNQ